MIYLDYNASAPLKKTVQEAIIDGISLIGNPSSQHQLGRVLRSRIEKARKSISHYLGINSKRLIFTSGATESNNLALKNFKGLVITSSIEHDSVLKARTDALFIKILPSGIIDLSHLEELLQKASQPVLVSVMAAHNETGVLQPLEEIQALCNRKKALFHTDGVQALTRVLLPWRRYSMLSFSAHKIGGPKGLGCLVIPEDLSLIPLIVGGEQEFSLRAGTENFLGIIGMEQAILDAPQDDWGRVEKLRNKMEDILFKESGAYIVARHSQRLPNTSMIAMRGVKSETQVMNFDLDKIAISSGSACSSGRIKKSTALNFLEREQSIIESCVRVSLGPETTAEEINSFIEVWKKIKEANTTDSCKPFSYQETNQHVRH